jgi:hypothetical protein
MSAVHLVRTDGSAHTELDVLAGFLRLMVVFHAVRVRSGARSPPFDPEANIRHFCTPLVVSRGGI